MCSATTTQKLALNNSVAPIVWGFLLGGTMKTLQQYQEWAATLGFTIEKNTKVRFGAPKNFSDKWKTYGGTLLQGYQVRYNGIEISNNDMMNTRDEFVYPNLKIVAETIKRISETRLDDNNTNIDTAPLYNHNIGEKNNEE